MCQSCETKEVKTETIETSEAEFIGPIQVFTCADCKDTSETEFDYNNDESEAICEDCYQDNYFSCEDCENITHNDNIETVKYRNNSHRLVEKYICKSCFDDNYFSCDLCQGHFSNDDSHSLPNDNSACENCYQENTNCCENCNETMWNDDSRYSEESERSLCESCFDDEENEAKFLPESKTYDKNPFRQYVGIELEILHDSTESNLRDNLDGICKVKDDGSLSTSESDFSSCNELVFNPANGDKLFSNIDKVGEALKNIAGINKTCGFHLHLDCRDTSETERENFYQGFKIIERVLIAMQPPSRYQNHYCKSIEGIDFAHAKRGDRYHTLNATSYSKHKTMEIRLHSGTIDPKKIKNWAYFMLSAFDVFSKINWTIDQLNDIRRLNNRELLIFLFQTVKMPMSLKKYIVKRIVHQNRKKTNGIFRIEPKARPIAIQQKLDLNERSSETLTGNNFQGLIVDESSSIQNVASGFIQDLT